MQALPLKLKNFRAVGFAGTVNRPGTRLHPSVGGVVSVPCPLRQGEGSRRPAAAAAAAPAPSLTWARSDAAPVGGRGPRRLAGNPYDEDYDSGTFASGSVTRI